MYFWVRSGSSRMLPGAWASFQRLGCRSSSGRVGLLLFLDPAMNALGCSLLAMTAGSLPDKALNKLLSILPSIHLFLFTLPLPFSLYRFQRSSWSSWDCRLEWILFMRQPCPQGQLLISVRETEIQGTRALQNSSGRRMIWRQS